MGEEKEYISQYLIEAILGVFWVLVILATIFNILFVTETTITLVEQITKTLLTTSGIILGFSFISISPLLEYWKRSPTSNFQLREKLIKILNNLLKIILSFTLVIISSIFSLIFISLLTSSLQVLPEKTYLQLLMGSVVISLICFFLGITGIIRFIYMFKSLIKH